MYNTDPGNQAYVFVLLPKHDFQPSSVFKTWIDSLGIDMSYGQYSWLITIKNGASHPMVHRDL